MHPADIRNRLHLLSLPELRQEAARYGWLAWQAEQRREQEGKRRPPYPRYEHLHYL